MCAFPSAPSGRSPRRVEALERLVGGAADWSRLDQYLLDYIVEPSLKATVIASSFAAALELVREGRLEVHQHGAFAPLYIRKRPDASGGRDDASSRGMDEGEAVRWRMSRRCV